MVVQGELHKFFYREQYVSFFDQQTDGSTDSENERRTRELQKRAANRIQRAVIKKASSESNTDFEVDSWFFTIANSEFCTDSLSHIQDNLTFEEFSDLCNQVDFYNDLKRAAEEDSEREQNKKQQANRQR